MIAFLTRHFIKDYQNTADPDVRRSYGVLCGCVGVFLNVLLFAGKFLAGAVSGSIAITADAFNNLSDAGSSVITLIGFQMAGQKPDPEHPFGHGRIEYLSGLLVSMTILLMAFELIRSSIDKIIHPSPSDAGALVFAVLLVSIAVKLYMAFYNAAVGKKLGSAGMRATATDSVSDCLATTAVLLATIFVRLTGIDIDGYCGVLVGLFILYAGYCAAKDTVSPLLGQKPDPELVNRIHKIVRSYDEIIGIHDLVVHDYGPGRLMISLHAEVPASGNILHLHDTIDCIEQKLNAQLSCEAVIHMDPILTDDAETSEYRDIVLGVLTRLDESLQIHDFRIVKGPTHTNLIFDVVTPYKYSLTDAQLKARIEESVQAVNPSLYTVIRVDKAYS